MSGSIAEVEVVGERSFLRSASDAEQVRRTMRGLAPTAARSKTKSPEDG